MLKFLRRRSGVGESKRRIKADAQQCSNSTDCIDDDHGQFEFADPEVTAVKLTPPCSSSSRSFSCPHIFKPPGAQAVGAFAQAVEIDISRDQNMTLRLSESDFTTSMDAGSEPQLADELAQSDASLGLRKQPISPTLDANKRRTASEGDLIDSAERDNLEMSNDELDAAEVAAYDTPLDDALAALLNGPCVPPNFPTPAEFSEHVARIDPTTEVRLPGLQLCLQSALYDCLEKHVTYAYLIRMTRTYLVKRLREDFRLSSKQINRVFPRHCIDSLVRLYCPLAQALQSQYDASAAKPLMRIADYSVILLQHYRTNECAIVDAYAELQANQATAHAELMAWRKEKQTSLDALRLEETCKQQGVEDLLLLFSTRLAYWPSIFEAIATYCVSAAARITTTAEKKMLETHANTWNQLIALSKSVVDQVESRTVVYENEKKLADLRHRFDSRVVALFYKPDSPPLEKAIAHQLQNVPSVVTRLAVRDVSSVLPVLSTVPARLLRYHGLFGKEQLSSSLRTLLHMDTVYWRNESKRLVPVIMVILSDFVLFLRDNETTSRIGFALDNKLCCAPINYVVMLQNVSNTNRELNELLLTTRFPHRNEESYQLQCSSPHACTQLLDAYKSAISNSQKSMGIDQSDRIHESRNKLVALVDQLDDQDSFIQKSISDKMALFCKICDLVHSQFGSRVTNDLRLSKLEATAEATQLGACLDASNKLYGLLRNPHLLTAVEPSNSNASISAMPVVTPRLTNVCDRAICSQEMQSATNATRVLCQSLSKVNMSVTQRRQELEAANLKYLQATAISTVTGDAARGVTNGDYDGLTSADVGTMHRHGTFVPAKQFAELRTIEEKLQADKLAWEQHLTNEHARFTALDKSLKEERDEIERTRAEVARQLEELKSRRVSFQQLVDQVNEVSPTPPPYYDGNMTSPTFSTFFAEPAQTKVDAHTHEAVHHRPSISSQTRLECPSTPQIQSAPPVPPRPSVLPTGTLQRTQKQSNVLTPSLLALSGTSSKKETKLASASKQQSDTPTRDRSMSLTTAMPKPKPSLFIHSSESAHKISRHHDDEQVHKVAL